MNILFVGGSKGLGLEVLDFLNNDENNIVYLSRSEVKDHYFVKNPIHVPFDLTWSEKDIKDTVKNTIKSKLQGHVDFLIVSSGFGAYTLPLVSDEFVKKMFQINVFGPQVVYREVQKWLLKSKGKAAFISSTSARRPGSGGLSYYASSKGALNSWIISEGRRAAKHGVGLFAVSPGFFKSEMTENMHPKLITATTKNIPFGRWGTSEEIARFTVDLLHQSNWTIAGQIYEATGGA